MLGYEEEKQKKKKLEASIKFTLTLLKRKHLIIFLKIDNLGALARE